MASESIDKKQITLIHVAKAELAKQKGFTDDDYRAFLQENFKVHSSKDLTGGQARRCIRLFQQMGFEPRRFDSSAKKSAARGAPPSDPGALITGAQQKVIAGLAALFQWNPYSLKGFSQRIIKKAWPQTHKEGQKLIYAMVAMNADEIHHSVINLRSKALTDWEWNFLFGHDRCAEKELKKFIAAKGKRGYRTMPRIALTKLIEIYEKRKDSYVPPDSEN